ncbi:MAG: DJ-1/PfpI family protein [Ignavibacteriales bacterium]|nr:DJ-1/PfpI family protein [Ignavibacteriales bacterium]
MHNYINSVALKKVLIEFYSQHKVMAAICLAPLVFANAGLLQNKQVAAHQSAKTELIRSGARFIDSDVVKDGNIITASGPQSVQKWAEMILLYI